MSKNLNENLQHFSLEPIVPEDGWVIRGDVTMHEGGSVFLGYIANAAMCILGARFALPDLAVRLTQEGKPRVDGPNAERLAKLDTDGVDLTAYPHGIFAPVTGYEGEAGDRTPIFTGKTVKRDAAYFPASSDTRELLVALAFSVPGIAERAAAGAKLIGERKALKKDAAPISDSTEAPAPVENFADLTAKIAAQIAEASA